MIITFSTADNAYRFFAAANAAGYSVTAEDDKTVVVSPKHLDFEVLSDIATAIVND